MDKTKPPGIAIDDISLIEANIGLNPPPTGDSSELQYHIQLTGFDRSEDDDKRLFVRCSFDLMGGVEEPPFDFTCTFVAVYSAMDDEANMTWEEFTDTMALAHVVPFLREFVANMTNRLPVPALMLFPVNVALLLSEYESRQESTGEQNLPS